eukprot:GGOE01001115.1.p1 GENE.GGOE01001115.1~~GGOE01001115.1.p1  ORF type:complete len:930 (+),score=176.45 GGOE01001115.1:157-2946(+)
MSQRSVHCVEKPPGFREWASEQLPEIEAFLALPQPRRIGTASLQHPSMPRPPTPSELPFHLLTFPEVPTGFSGMRILGEEFPRSHALQFAPFPDVACVDKPVLDRWVRLLSKPFIVAELLVAVDWWTRLSVSLEGGALSVVDCLVFEALDRLPDGKKRLREKLTPKLPNFRRWLEWVRKETQELEDRLSRISPRTVEKPFVDNPSRPPLTTTGPASPQLLRSPEIPATAASRDEEHAPKLLPLPPRCDVLREAAATALPASCAGCFLRTEALLASPAVLAPVSAASLGAWAELLAQPSLPLAQLQLCMALDFRSRSTVCLDSSDFSAVDALVAEALDRQGRRLPEQEQLLLQLPHFCRWHTWAVNKMEGHEREACNSMEGSTSIRPLNSGAADASTSPNALQTFERDPAGEVPFSHLLPAFDDGPRDPEPASDLSAAWNIFPKTYELFRRRPNDFRPVGQQTLDKWLQVVSRPFTVVDCLKFCIAVDQRVRHTIAIAAPALSIVDVLVYEVLLSTCPDTVRDMRWRRQGCLKYFHRWMRWVEAWLALRISAWPCKVPVAPQYCGRRWLTVNASALDLPGGFTIVSYNMLASFHLQDHRSRPDAGRRKPEDQRTHADTHRVPRLVTELLSYDATFMCLQEVDATDFNGRSSLPDMLNAEHNRYAWRYQPRPAPHAAKNGPPRVDGLAVVWDRTRARPIYEEEWGFIDFNEIAVDAQSLTNNGALHAFFEVDGQSLCLICAYVHWDPKKEVLKGNQVRHLRGYAQKTAAKLGLQAIVIAGDFNSVPGSEAYDAMVAPSKGGFSSAYGNYLELERTQLPAPFRQSGGCSHSSREQHCEPRFTNVNVPKRFCDTLDYVFYRPSVLAPRRVLHFPWPSETASLPNEIWGSDHLALVADLVFLPPKDTRNGTKAARKGPPLAQDDRSPTRVETVP